MKPYKVLTINPGSTSTKIALFEGEECLYSQTVSHEAKELEQYASMSEQLPYRRDTVLNLLKEAGIGLEEVDVFVYIRKIPIIFAHIKRTIKRHFVFFYLFVNNLFT